MAHKFNKEVHKQLFQENTEKIKGFKAKMDRERTITDKAADLLTAYFGTILFFTLNAIFFAVWMFVNLGIIPGVPVFDPFPYGLLTMVVSLEAIFLAIIVLISQNRAAKIADIREEIDLQINLRAEQEITRILIILDEIHDHIGLPAEDDDELIFMKRKTDIDQVEREIIAEMNGN